MKQFISRIYTGLRELTPYLLILFCVITICWCIANSLLILGVAATITLILVMSYLVGY